MSETKTIEERYEQLIQATVDGEDTDVIALHAASLITDLMAEREKMKERNAKLYVRLLSIESTLSEMISPISELLIEEAEDK